MKPHRLAPASLALVLAACAQPGPPPPPPPPPVDPVAALKAIRAAGDGLDSAVQVQPLRDAAIEGFMQRARDAEAHQDYAAAASAADDALALAPDAPDLLQYRAEIDVARAQWREAERLALKSHALGPRSGSLCARNWQTVVEARTALGDAPTVEAARERLKECRIKPLLRM
ncbi:MAG TPA: tetratricopeptide repeat protein [Dokdonella sp.]|nr:tetratricopeptide repeat protein [Dokdonella sp.]